jgi:hypothetical protein
MKVFKKLKFDKVENWRNQSLKKSKIKEIKDLKKSKIEEVED